MSKALLVIAILVLILGQLLVIISKELLAVGGRWPEEASTG